MLMFKRAPTFNPRLARLLRLRLRLTQAQAQRSNKTCASHIE